MPASRPFECVRVEIDPERAEWASAEAFEAGAAGVEERDGEGCTILLAYAPAEAAAAVEAALRAVAGEGAVATRERVTPRDWPETWKQGLRPLVVSPRLVVRPEFAACELAPGQREVVIEPRQAFGTGAHGSTALALALLDERLAAAAGGRVLDVGCGSGVLAIAALALGARRAVACDLDPIAARETRENAIRNGHSVASFAGSLDALASGRFDLVVANLISSELLPILDALVDRVAADGAIVLSGLLLPERAGVEARLAARGLSIRAARDELDARGDHWLGLMASR
ncbi:MAG: 50S ribosomal protein L11 methyltransferase [Myxococcota bacterium]|nr:50S ribosomal protein L11 methyltransferase [Myxococcota bacterium]